MWGKELFCWAEEQPQGHLNGLLLEGLENCQQEIGNPEMMASDFP